MDKLRGKSKERNEFSYKPYVNTGCILLEQDVFIVALLEGKEIAAPSKLSGPVQIILSFFS